MTSYIEVFRPASGAKPDGRIFYTIQPEDVGQGVLTTTAEPIHVSEFMGRIQPQDVGKRLYRGPCEDPRAPWIWQAENDRQRDARLAQEAAS